MTYGLNQQECGAGSTRNSPRETDGLREQVQILKELSEKLDSYFELRSLGAGSPTNDGNGWD